MFSNYCSPVRFPWLRIKDDGTPVNRLHCLIYDLQWKRGVKAKLLLKAVLWPLKAFLMAFHDAFLYGLTVERDFGISRWKQWWRMFYLANFYNLSPYVFYKFGFYKDSHYARAAAFIQHIEMDAMYQALFSGVDNGIIDDKLRFYARCRERGIPVLFVEVVFQDDGRIEWPAGAAKSFPLCDLFLKYTNSSLGVGAEAWKYDAAARTWQRDGISLDERLFIAYCVKKSRAERKPVLVQRRLVNSPEIVQFTTGALSTFRVVTYVGPDGKIGILSAGLKRPVGAMEVDNSRAGGIVAGIELETGVLMPASSRSFPGQLMPQHPDTGATISGHRLSCWQEVRVLSLKAQAAFPEIWSVGWDIAMTDQGLVMIEGNTDYGLLLAQRCITQPLGETIFPTLCLNILEKKSCARS